VECHKTVVNINNKTTKDQRFTYITNVTQNGQNMVQTADSGRLSGRLETKGSIRRKTRGMNWCTRFRAFQPCKTIINCTDGTNDQPTG
jgi:hypothetical protein